MSLHSPASQSLRLAGYYGALFLALGVYLPFWPLWLGHRGLDAAQIGLVLALGAWIKLLGNPLLGLLADRGGRRKTTIVAIALLSTLSFALFPAAEGFWAILAVQLVWAFLFNALVPLGESQAMTAAIRHGLDYGRIRLWGSLAFILGALGAGALLTGRGPDLVVWLILGGLALTAAAAATLPGEAAPLEGTGGLARLGLLLRDRGFLLFLGAGSLLQASHAVYYGFSAIHWRAAGHSAATVGWLWAEGVIAEVLLFAVGGALVRRLGPNGLLLAAAAGGLLRWSVLGATTALPALIAVQALHALSFAAAHLGAMHIIARSAAPSLSASAQAVYAALSGGLLMGLATLAAGALYESLAGGAFLVMAAVSLAGGLLALARTRRG